MREGPAWPRWIAVAGGLGYLPLAPGTAGSLLGVLVFVGIAWSVSFAFPPSASEYVLEGSVLTGILGLVIGSGLVVGAWAATRAEDDFGRKDDGRIVIDEVVGQLIALAPLPFLVGLAELPSIPFVPGTPFGPDVSTTPPDPFRFFGWVVTGFVLFRVFDVWKPGAVSWAERRFTGGFGVMMDDVVAGLHGALALAALHFAFCGVFGCMADGSGTANTSATSMNRQGTYHATRSCPAMNRAAIHPTRPSLPTLPTIERPNTSGPNRNPASTPGSGRLASLASVSVSELGSGFDRVGPLARAGLRVGFEVCA